MTVGDVGSVISVLESYTWLNSLDFERASHSLHWRYSERPKGKWSLGWID